MVIVGNEAKGKSGSGKCERGGNAAYVQCLARWYAFEIPRPLPFVFLVDDGLQHIDHLCLCGRLRAS